ncbi:MAG: potassium channel family protein [Rhodopila sp.]
MAIIVAAPSLVPMLAVIGALLFNAAAAILVRLPNAGALTYWADMVGGVLSIAGLSWVVIQVVFGPGEIDRHRIVGAIVLYLNVALLFEALYRLIAELSPGAFMGLPPVFGTSRVTGNLIYFSMVTLTTVGYGDIVPVHPIARSLSNMEALIGQLYPAIILARIMTLYRTGR